MAAQRDRQRESWPLTNAHAPPVASADDVQALAVSPAAKVFRVAIAGVAPEWLAYEAQKHEVEGVITQATGVTVKWGVESCVILESATSQPDKFRRFVLALLKDLDQECAYVTINGSRPRLLYAAGYEIPL